MTRRRVFPLGAALAAAAIGCGTSNSETPDAGTSVSPVEAFCMKAVSALAQRQVGCQGLPSSAAAIPALHATSSGKCRNLAKAADANRVKHDASKEQACLDAIPKASCDSIGSDLAAIAAVAACAEAVSGQVAAEGSCYLDLECTGDARCDTGDACPGTCISRVAAGDSCSSSDDCTAGAKCRDDNHTCVAVKKSGPCVVEEECADGYTCAGTSTCTAAKKLDDPCAVGEGECPDLTYCAGAPAKCTLWPSTGAACDESGQTGEYPFCLGGSCVNGICAEHFAVGASCTEPSQCDSGNCKSDSCAPVEGACLAP